MQSVIGLGMQNICKYTVYSIVHKTTFDKILKVIKISQKLSITLSVLLGILSLDSKDNLSSHSHLSNSQKSKLNWGSMAHMCMPSFRKYKHLKVALPLYLYVKALEAIIVHKKDWGTVARFNWRFKPVIQGVYPSVFLQLYIC